jgi:hypothetical protein
MLEIERIEPAIDAGESALHRIEPPLDPLEARRGGPDDLSQHCDTALHVGRTPATSCRFNGRVGHRGGSLHA